MEPVDLPVDVVAAAKEGLRHARHTAAYRMLAPGSGPWDDHVVQAVLTAAIPQIRKHERKRIDEVIDLLEDIRKVSVRENGRLTPQAILYLTAALNAIHVIRGKDNE
jgi:hypothetical protein